MQICTVLYFSFMVEPRGIEDTLVCTPARRSASERHRRSDQMGSISLCFVPLIKNPPLRGGFFIGGAEGNRTPVRKQLGKSFSGRSLLFTFPHPGESKHPTGVSSFMIHGTRKA